jgi:hypothetical protein
VLKLGTRHRKDSLHREGREASRRKKRLHCAVYGRRKIEASRSEVPRDESQVSVGGLLALGYGRK